MAALRLGIIGKSLGHSLSPALHGYLLEQAGLMGKYEKYPVERKNLSGLLAEFSKTGLLGFNVTVPYKQDIMPHLSSLSDEAAIISAVNTVVLRSDGMRGYNTDVAGFMTSLKARKIEVEGRKVLLLGAGGAARSILYGLLRDSVGHIVLANRTHTRATELRRQMLKRFPDANLSVSQGNKENLLAEIETGTLIVNTTAVGMWPMVEQVPLNLHQLPRDVVVADIVYNPLETQLLRDASGLGATTVDGLDMLIYQGVAAFEIWTEKVAKFNYDELRMKLVRELGTYAQN